MHHAVVVRAEAFFLESESDAAQNRYAFGYVVRIRNDGTTPVQLLSRHWVITDSNGDVREVCGEGVVGEQPVIAPGQTYEYSSGTVLASGVGIMHGEYHLIDADGVRFVAPIPSFTLTVPRVLH